MSRDEDAEVMIATHNQKSIERAVSLMHELEVQPQKSGVYFGQLLGMADHLTFILGRNGFRVSWANDVLLAFPVRRISLCPTCHYWWASSRSTVLPYSWSATNANSYSPLHSIWSLD